MKLKSLAIAAVAALGLLALPVKAQTTNTTIPQFITTSYDALIGAGLTNLDVSEGVTYTHGIYGEFTTVHRNLDIGGGAFVAPGVGVEEFAGYWYALQLQTSLGVNVTPLSGWSSVLGSTIGNAVVTPFTTVGTEVPFGDNVTTGVGAFAAGGGVLHLATVKWLLNADFGIGGAIGERTGWVQSRMNGKFYTGFINLFWPIGNSPYVMSQADEAWWKS